MSESGAGGWQHGLCLLHLLQKKMEVGLGRALHPSSVLAGTAAAAVTAK